jgi:DNA mismatch endonuclease, patch repair protein
MPDVVDAATRSRMMSGIRGRNTKPEIALRRALHARGLRYRLHVKALQGSPDLVFPRFNAAVFINGCFWHGHTCNQFRLPGTRQEFWSAKIHGNRARDSRNVEALSLVGLRVLTVWECALRGPGRLGLDATADLAAEWIKGDSRLYEIRGS